MGAVKFVMYEKLLFWMEVMNALGKAHEMFGILTQALAWPGNGGVSPSCLLQYMSDAGWTDTRS